MAEFTANVTPVGASQAPPPMFLVIFLKKKNKKTKN
jgi:hypothetical protein